MRLEWLCLWVQWRHKTTTLMKHSCTGFLVFNVNQATVGPSTMHTHIKALCFFFLWCILMSCAFWSGEPSSDLCHVCNSQTERPEGFGLHRCTVSGGLPGSRGCLFGPAEKRTHQQLCEQGQLMSDLRIAFSIFEALRHHVTISILWTPSLKVPLDLNAGQALGIEVLCTFQMVFTVFAVCDQKRRECIEPGNLAIGLAHSTGVLLGVRMAFFSTHVFCCCFCY